MKSLKELKGYSSEEIIELSAKILEKGLRGQMMEELGYETRKESSFLDTLESDISYDLGDEEPEEEPQKKQKKPKTLTESMLEDEEVEDPQHEAIAEADAAVDFNYIVEEIDPRAARRKKPQPTIRGKVREATEVDNENLP